MASRINGTRSRAAIESAAGNADNFVRYVDEMLEILSWDSVPFLKLIGINGPESPNTKQEWMMDDLLSEKVTLSAAQVVTAATQLTIVTPGGASLQIGSVLMFSNPGGTAKEYLLVTAINSLTSVDVTRGIWGTTPDLIGTSAEGIIVGVAMDEGSDTPMKGSTIPTFEYNYHQIFESGFKITQRQKNSKQYGITNDEDYQLEKTTKELMIKLEYASIYGLRGAGTDGPMSMGGMDEFIATNATNLEGAALEENDLMDELQDLWYDVGSDNMGKTILCGGWVKRKIASWYDPKFQMKSGETTGGVKIDRLTTDFGDLDILMLNRIPKSTLYIVNPKFMKVNAFKGSKFGHFVRPANGQYDVHAVYGDYSMKVRNERAMAKIYNISTSA